MPEYKLIYFNVRGKGECIRYLFHLAGQKFVDERVEKEEWQELKPTTLWGILPELNIDGKPLCQSGAIERHLAREFGFMGNSEADTVYIDMLSGCGDDISGPVVAIFFEKDEAKKTEMKKKHDESLSGQLKRLERFLCANKEGDGWFVGETVTLADIRLYHSFTRIAVMYPTALDSYPKLKAHSKRFEELPKIATYIAKRPKTTM